MNQRRIGITVLICAIVVGLLLAWGICVHMSGKFDDERFQQDVERIEGWYLGHQEALERIAQNFWEHEEINSISVSSLEERTVELWSEQGRIEAFAEEYPQLYDDVSAILGTDLPWMSFSRRDGQGDGIECSFLHERYETGKWTAFYLCFYEKGKSSADVGEYYTQLSDECFLVVKTYPME